MYLKKPYYHFINIQHVVNKHTFKSYSNLNDYTAINYLFFVVQQQGI